MCVCVCERDKFCQLVSIRQFLRLYSSWIEQRIVCAVCVCVCVCVWAYLFAATVDTKNTEWFYSLQHLRLVSLAA